MKGKERRILFSILAALFLIIAALSYLNRQKLASVNNIDSAPVFCVYDRDGSFMCFDMEAMAKVGEQTFEADLKESGNPAVTHSYTGVLLKDLMDEAGYALEGLGGIVVTAMDGYTVAVAMEKVLEDNNVYLVYRRDGELLKPKDEGGDGPFQLVIARDPFSQYWCKFAYKAELMP